MSLKAYLIIAALVGGFLLAGFIKYKIDQYEKAIIQNEILKEENKEIKTDVKKLASRPRTNGDVVNRLCDWGKNVRKTEPRATKQPIPVFCR